MINLVLHNDLCSDSLSNNYTAFNFCYTNALPNTYICALLNKIVKCCVSIIVLVYKLVLNVKSYVTVFVNCEFQEFLFSYILVNSVCLLNIGQSLEYAKLKVVYLKLSHQ